jgi:pentatricopeptide repeat protein
MGTDEEDEGFRRFVSSHAPLDTLYTIKQGILEWIDKGDLKNVNALYVHLRDQWKHYRFNDDAASLLGQGTTTLVMAYAKSGDMEKTESILHELEDMKDSRGRPLVSVSVLRQALSIMRPRQR